MLQKAKNILRLAKKGLHVLVDNGPQALFEAYRERRRIQKSVNKDIGEPLKRKAYDTKVATYRGRKVSIETLKQTLSSTSGIFVLALSQDNFLQVNGGVQLTIGKEANQHISKKSNFLHIFPYWQRETLDFSQGHAWYGLSLNKQLLGYIEETELIDLLKQVLPGRFSALHIHHAMAFRLSFLDEMLTLKGAKNAFFWIHDFFTLCPNYFLLRNEKQFCNAPPLESNACAICSYGSIRPKHLQGFVDLFQRHAIQVIAPSQFALEFWNARFPVKNILGEVRSHGQLKFQKPKHHRKATDPIKVAFLGYPAFHKGWQTWVTLTNKFAADPRYQFVVFTKNQIKSPHYETVSVAVTPEDPKAMVNALRENDIDVAILWSLCPETYSFTLKEALEAGCHIITNPFSGNIQKQVKKNNFGVVLEDDAALLAYFEEGCIVESLPH